MRITSFAPALLALGIAAGPAAAHDFILLPDDFTPATGQAVTINATVTAAFPKLESVVGLERMGEKVARAGGAATPLAAVGDGAAARLTYSPKSPGDAIVAVSIPPREVEYAHDRIELILEEYDIHGPVAAAVRALPASSPLKVTSSRFAKSALCVDSCRDADDLRQPVGFALEFVGVDGGGYRLLSGGKPLADHPVAIGTADGKRLRLKSGGDGRVMLPSELRGPVMLFAAVMTSPAAAGGRFALNLTTLTVER